MKKFIISSEHNVYVDTYKEGEMELVSGYSINNTIIEAENAREAIQKYFENTLHFSFNFDFACIDNEEQINETKNTLNYSNLVDSENREASEKEIELWKKNELRLYSCNTFLTINEIVETAI